MTVIDNTAQWKVKKITNVQNNFDGYWQANEVVEVGTLRFPRGSENTGYILECVEAGTTGEAQPEIVSSDANEIANYSDLGRIGQVRVIFNLAEKDVDEILAMGITYSRLTYPELWEWAGKRAGLIISEEEWQAKFAETNGKFVPYYSSGDGSSTFRTPLLGAYLKGAENSADVGKWLDAGLPNIEGSFNGYFPDYSGEETMLHSDGAFDYHWTANAGMVSGDNGSTWGINFQANRWNPIYGNSDTVTPETMTGIWVIKAVGVVVDSGETDIANMLTATEEVQERVSVVEDWTKDSSNFSSMPSNQFISISLSGDDTYYKVPTDGWVYFTADRVSDSKLATVQLWGTNEAQSTLYKQIVQTTGGTRSECILPVAKGMFARIIYATVNSPQAYFFYAQSEV